MIARNSASSRAIPVERILAAVESDPVIPQALPWPACRRR
jgi:hypothetical protein